MRTHRFSLLGAVVVVAVLTGGCGGYGGGSKKASSTATPASSGGTVVKTVTVHETEYKLTPNTISLAKAGTYVFKGVNDGTTTHSLAVQGNGVDATGSDISPGHSGMLKVTLPKKGTYEIFCPVDGHKALGMKGTVTVGGAGSGGGTSTENTNTGTGGTTTYSTGY
ncbi:MAG TPA: plastocyanin/azurin family copper-binding protein [Gaiellaceae bacterium]|nr:plastocyanin/azurin family copper-binding protein [Gaiellaceae bacterium]